tara:strand:+ start:508 stop:693 length:186 start_codon:yes stop_codon:yes gene_type:complete
MLVNQIKPKLHSNQLNHLNKLNKLINKNKNFIPIPWLNNDNIETVIGNVRKQDKLNNIYCF